jgi:hypothetical protein
LRTHDFVFAKASRISRFAFGHQPAFFLSAVARRNLSPEGMQWKA